MGAVLCCSSRRVGGVVPVEPVLGDLRARGQDQDAAVRGPAARRESLRGPRAAGQALQYRELPGSVHPSPLLLLPLGNARGWHWPGARTTLLAWGCGALRDGWHRHGDLGQPMGAWDMGCTLLALLETSQLCWPCWGT